MAERGKAGGTAGGGTAAAVAEVGGRKGTTGRPARGGNEGELACVGARETTGAAAGMDGRGADWRAVRTGTDELVDVDDREGDVEANVDELRERGWTRGGTALGWRGGRRDTDCACAWWPAGRTGMTGGSIAGWTGCVGEPAAAVVPVPVVEGNVVARTDRSGVSGDTTDDSLEPADAALSAGLLALLLLPLPPPPVPLPAPPEAAAAAAAAASSCCFLSDGSTLMCTLDRSTCGWLGLVRSSTL